MDNSAYITDFFTAELYLSSVNNVLFLNEPLAD